jgi:asparagine synthase (glutamine-hydrolysing)
MCGINGIFAYAADAPPLARGELLATRDHMSARGPDGAGVWYSGDGRAGFGHRRLSIIDLSELGAQPMTAYGGRLCVTFNGEIYNHRELRRQLEADGVRFRSNSDTEVLLHLYRRDGERMVDRLRGMFAFAIWDDEAKVTFLARDPYGIKPLYYCDDGKTLRFASQVKALLAGGGVDRSLEPAGVVGFLQWGSVPEPFTIIRGVRMLPAGSTLTVTERGPAAVRSYWDVRDALPRAIAAAAAVPPGAEREVAGAALRDSVRAHMVADVPVGAFLSAGLDSSAVVGLAREVASDTLRTITVSFEDFRDTGLDELPLAEQVARHLGVQHTPVSLTMADVEADLPRFFESMDQPTVDGINTWLVSKAAAQAGLKVALSGLGGDELLGGYATFRAVPEIVRRYGGMARLPIIGRAYRSAHAALNPYLTFLDPTRAGLIELARDCESAYRIVRGVFMPWELRHVLDGDFAEAGRAALEAHARERGDGSISAFAQLIALESTRYMRNQLLRDTDWVSMAHSLEVRVPLVDRILTETIAGLAITGRLGEAKSVLPASLAHPLPHEVLARPKSGFTVPMWKWLRKSPPLAAWKRVRMLCRPNVRDAKRLAFNVLAGMPEAREIVRLS